MKIEHVAFNVADPVAVAAWYVEYLDMSVVRKLDIAAQTHFLADSSGQVMIEIYNNPADHFVASFIGESTFLSLTKSGSDFLFFGTQRISKVPNHRSHKNWSLVIRPERLSIQNSNSRKVKSKLYFDGSIVELVYQGETAFILVTLDDGNEISVRHGTDAVSSTSLLKSGARVSAYLRLRDAIVIPAGTS